MRDTESACRGTETSSIFRNPALFAIAGMALFLTASSTIASTSSRTGAASPGKMRSALQAMYDLENAAAGKKNAHGMLAYVSPKFVGVDAKGKHVTYDDLRDSAQQVFDMAANLQAGTIVRDCKVTGDKAVVHVDDEVRIVVSGPDKDKTHVVDTSSSKDTWTKTPAGWRLTSSRTLTHKVTVDGQPTDDDSMGLPSF